MNLKTDISVRWYLVKRSSSYSRINLSVVSPLKINGCSQHRLLIANLVTFRKAIVSQFN